MVAFESPVPKMYNMLPPPMADLDDVLAILFTGPCRPSEEDMKRDMKRVPVLVRRKAVRAALEWLRLNHPDYEDVGISEVNLESYPEDCPPVSVVYQERHTNKIAEATSVHDNGEEEGVEAGDCPFVVHGLMGEQLGAISVDELKGMALKHWKSGGKALRVGSSGNLESIYDNPDLYPRMFPWLFPYGLGGIGSTPLSDAKHKKHLLMYHDKRFQTDLAFPFAAFSHQQIKDGSSGSFLCAEAANFHQITDRLLNVNQDVLEDLSKRMERGDIVKPQTEAEKSCFQVIKDLDQVGGKVKGSVASKKYMRNEIWSLIANQGAPSWYITLSPADLCHPICLYYADKKESFDPILRSGDERFRLIAHNPVAAARFFDFMVRLFIKHVLGFGSDHSGLYGDTSAFYGTVEQQGRLTLHLHLLLWIRNGLAPDDARKLIMDPSSPFQRELVQYLEAAHQGEFNTGTIDDVRAAVDAAAKSPDYKKPTETLPEPPPNPCSDDCGQPPCGQCDKLATWWTRFKFTVDDLLLKSNVHTCRSTVNKDGSKSKKKQYEGCLDNKWGTCRSRFPRPIFKQTEVDPATGSLHIKKLESWINTFSSTVTYLFRCNTDVTSMRSGTAIKGVMHYVTKYVTKTSLKTHVIFDTVRTMFRKNAEVVGGSASCTDKARKLMTKIVNCLGVKTEMGSPMICMYLLQNPDHYTSHSFRTFYWQDFVREAMSAFPEHASSSLHPPEKVVLVKRNGRVIGLSHLYDYVYRATELESMCLYDWVARFHRIKGDNVTDMTSAQHLKVDAEEDKDISECKVEHHNGGEWPEGGGGPAVKNNKKRAKSTIHAFLPDHPLSTTHSTVCVDAKHGVVPNFAGRALPRRDQGDREYYCATMLTMFKPWRSGLDLRTKIDAPFKPGGPDESYSSWDEAFVAAKFLPRHDTLIKNFNIQYECMDAQDDFHAQMKKGTVHLPGSMDAHMSYISNFQQDQQIDDFTFDEANIDCNEILGSVDSARGHSTVIAEIQSMTGIMNAEGWRDPQPQLLPDDTDLCPTAPLIEQPGSMWKASVAKKRALILDERARNLPGGKKHSKNHGDPNVVEIVDKSYLNRKCKSGKWASTIDNLVLDFGLNKEQCRAFTIVANHAANPASEQLKMYIGGMGGTGKTQVLKALMKYFDMRKETHRIIVVAPTGTAASLLGGSTYHYMFGISDIDGQRNTQLAQVKTRLTGVDYVFFDEVSMLSCRDLYRISARLAHVLGDADTPFGGMNMIFAGDFAQLPPAMGGEAISLYSRTVGEGGVSLRNQESAIGKALWHQVTTVVILRQNMRQSIQSAEDTKLRKALENMRYKSCTPEDLIFLRSRVSSKSPGKPSIIDKEFRNVSIITGLNRVKDAINGIGSERFAKETNQTLTHFYSEDLITPLEDADIRKQRLAAGVRARVKKSMPSEKDQMALWESPHCRNTPVGVAWRDNSCAYDVPVVLLHNIWRQKPDTITELLTFCNSEILASLIAQFSYAATLQPVRLENLCDTLRHSLFVKSPSTFPWGQYTSVHSMFDYIFDSRVQASPHGEIASKSTGPYRAQGESLGVLMKSRRYGPLHEDFDFEEHLNVPDAHRMPEIPLSLRVSRNVDIKKYNDESIFKTVSAKETPCPRPVDLDIGPTLCQPYAYTDEEMQEMVDSQAVCATLSPLPLELVRFIEAEHLRSKKVAEVDRQDKDMESKAWTRLLGSMCLVDPVKRVPAQRDRITIPTTYLLCIKNKLCPPLNFFTNDRIDLVNYSPQDVHFKLLRPWSDEDSSEKVQLLDMPKMISMWGADDVSTCLTPYRYTEASADLLTALELLCNPLSSSTSTSTTGTETPSSEAATSVYSYATEFKKHRDFFLQLDNYETTFKDWYPFEVKACRDILKGILFDWDVYASEVLLRICLGSLERERKAATPAFKRPFEQGHFTGSKTPRASRSDSAPSQIALASPFGPELDECLNVSYVDAVTPFGSNRAQSRPSKTESLSTLNSETTPCGPQNPAKGSRESVRFLTSTGSAADIVWRTTRRFRTYLILRVHV
ncbi:hypothetical protein D9615_002210 [Tricholomella constricta]|uniref:ATP-dependent DNA helicase n=1 Tax=Tricholomella constricta TaxID=117010 RepID=A0A8H5M9I9_9AGAR|nr:hypothetical protein D9615_002210 [Tricholomella constricta]